jgi:hypothetical protein
MPTPKKAGEGAMRQDCQFPSSWLRDEDFFFLFAINLVRAESTTSILSLLAPEPARRLSSMGLCRGASRIYDELA